MTESRDQSGEIAPHAATHPKRGLKHHLSGIFGRNQTETHARTERLREWQAAYTHRVEQLASDLDVSSALGLTEPEENAYFADALGGTLAQKLAKSNVVLNLDTRKEQKLPDELLSLLKQTLPPPDRSTDVRDERRIMVERELRDAAQQAISFLFPPFYESGRTHMDIHVLDRFAAPFLSPASSAVPSIFEDKEVMAQQFKDNPQIHRRKVSIEEWKKIYPAKASQPEE